MQVAPRNLTITDIRSMPEDAVHSALLARGMEPLVPGEAYTGKKRVRIFNDLLLLLIDEPTRFDMSSWMHATIYDKESTYNIGQYDEDGEYFDEEARTEVWNTPACGTVGCVAGWITAMYPPKGYQEFKAVSVPLPTLEESGLSPDILGMRSDAESHIAHIAPDRAALVLNLCSFEEARKIFHVRRWPRYIQEQYSKANTAKDLVLILRERLQTFLSFGR